MEFGLVNIWVLLVEAIGFLLIDRKILIYYTIAVLFTVMLFFFL